MSEVTVLAPSILYKMPCSIGCCDRQGDSTHKPILFTPVLKTPPHPEYPSTHSSAAGAWGEVLAKYLKISISQDTPNGAYTVETESYLLPPRTFKTIEAAADEVALSR